MALETDQRGAGFERVAGTAADIGAYERVERLFADGFDAAAGGPRAGACPIRMTALDS